jgi:NADPH2:quinone reductase
VEIIADREQPDPVTAIVRQLGGPLDAVADLVGQGMLARSLSGLKNGGAAGSIVELRGNLDEAIDRNVRIHGVLVHPDRRTLNRLGEAVEAGALRAIVDAVVDPELIAQAHRRVETGHGQGKIVLRMTA